MPSQPLEKGIDVWLLGEDKATMTLNSANWSFESLAVDVSSTLSSPCMSTARQQKTVPFTVRVIGWPHRDFFVRKSLAICLGPRVKKRSSLVCSSSFSPLRLGTIDGWVGYRANNRAPTPRLSTIIATPSTRNGLSWRRVLESFFLWLPFEPFAPFPVIFFLKTLMEVVGIRIFCMDREATADSWFQCRHSCAIGSKLSAYLICSLGCRLALVVGVLLRQLSPFSVCWWLRSFVSQQRVLKKKKIKPETVRRASACASAYKKLRERSTDSQ